MTATTDRTYDRKRSVRTLLQLLQAGGRPHMGPASWRRREARQRGFACPGQVRVSAPTRPRALAWGASPSRAGALATPAADIDRAIRNGETERGADGAFDQADFTAMGAHQLGDNGKAEPGAACAGRALERFEQMGAGASGSPGPVSATLITTTAPSRRPVTRI